MKNITILFLLFSFSSFAQDYYFVKDNDTIYAKNIVYYKNYQSYLKEINYTDLNDNSIVITDKKELLKVSQFYLNGKIMDKIPQKVHRPNSYIKWAERVADGKLIVNYYDNPTTFKNVYGIGNSFHANYTMQGSIGLGKDFHATYTKFFVKMPDGKFYNILKRKHRKKIIIPYLKQCANFVNAYKGNYNPDKDSFIETIKLYNSLCE